MAEEAPERRDNGLETLARERFGDLSQAELRLLKAAAKGAIACCGPSRQDDDPGDDPAKADQWGPEREVRAELIRWLCVDSSARGAVDPRGIQVLGARIAGRLDLGFVHVPFPLALLRCRLTEPAILTSAHLPALNLRGSRVQSILADGAHVEGDVLLTNSFTAEGEVRLLDAQVGGSLECDGGIFKNPGGVTLNADRLNVKGSVFLREGFNAEGEVRLLSAAIGGSLDCDGGIFNNPAGGALSAEGANIAGSVFLRRGFSSEGEVRLSGTHIRGSLDCSECSKTRAGSR
jgi:hypothetical protein